jgi:ribosomal protein L32
MALRRCDHCGHEVPASHFCIRCGHELEGGQTQLTRITQIARSSAVSGLTSIMKIDPGSLSGVRRAFAAAPDESVLRPTIVSTIFPQLPRPSMTVFRICLALGVATVLLLGLAKLYPVALIAGALLLPMLVVLYMFSVNIFEQQSLTVTGGTIAWGAVTGVITALIAKAISPSGTQVFVHGESDLLLSRGVLIPLLSGILILGGPMTLLRFPRFATVLDGATFAAASGSAFVGAEVIVQAASTLGHGLRPPGAVTPWLVQLAIIAVGLPLVTMAAMASVSGVVWLKLRAPIRDRSALGRLGSPAIVGPLAAVLLVAPAIVQLELAQGIALVVILLLAVVALTWLRQVIHVGLLEEALLIEDAPIIACANCGERTRRGSFCENCGIALSALPGSRTSVSPSRRTPKVGRRSE